jgi:hypothetical protein
LCGRRRSVAAGGDTRLVLFGLEAVEFFGRSDDVRDVEKAVALETEVNERRLHAGQHFGYPALVQIANYAALPFALDKNLGDLVFLEDCNPCLVGARGDDHLLGHARNSPRAEDAHDGAPPSPPVSVTARV